MSNYYVGEPYRLNLWFPQIHLTLYKITPIKQIPSQAIRKLNTPTEWIGFMGDEELKYWEDCKANNYKLVITKISEKPNERYKVEIYDIKQRFSQKTESGAVYEIDCCYPEPSFIFYSEGIHIVSDQFGHPRDYEDDAKKKD